MTQITADCISGILLSNVPLKSILSCQRTCLFTTNCLYTVVDEINERCLLLGAGINIYQTKDKRIFFISQFSEHFVDPTQSNGIGLPCGAFGQCVTVLNSTAGYSCQCTSNLNGTNCTESIDASTNSPTTIQLPQTSTSVYVSQTTKSITTSTQAIIATDASTRSPSTIQLPQTSTSVYVSQTTKSFTTATQATIDILDAFNAVRNTTAIGSSSTVSFNKIYNTLHSSFNATSMSCCVQSSSNRSLYWMHIAVDVPSGTAATLKLSDTSLSVYATQTTYSVTITMAMSGVIQVLPNTQLNLIAATNTLATYWAAFRIDNLFDPLIAFRVVRTTSMTAQGQITFNTVLVSEGNAWSSATDKFTAPCNGIYLFSYSSGIQSSNGANLNLNLNGATLSRRVAGGYGDMFASGVDMVSRNTVIYLVTGDVVHLTYSQKNNLYSDATYRPIAFSGFYYAPINTIQVAWSVVSTSTGTSGAQSLLSFAITVVNSGGAWNSTLNKVVIPVAGTYFVHMDIASCPAAGSIAEVWLNSGIAFRVQNAFVASTTIGHMRNHAAVLKLNVGDQLHVAIPATPSVCYFSGAAYGTAFTGLLLA